MSTFPIGSEKNGGYPHLTIMGVSIASRYDQKHEMETMLSALIRAQCDEGIRSTLGGCDLIGGPRGSFISDLFWNSKAGGLAIDLRTDRIDPATDIAKLASAIGSAFTYAILGRNGFHNGITVRYGGESIEIEGEWR